MSTRSSSSTGELTAAKILAWARGLETFDRIEFVYSLMHTLYPTELHFIHGIVDGLLKRDESLYATSVQQANDFARLSQFYEGCSPQTVIANDGLRRQLILDLSALHPLNFYCADIFFTVLQRAELGTWTFARDQQKMLRELILITVMVVRHAAFRFDHRVYLWNISRQLMARLKELKDEEEEEAAHQDTEEELENPVIHPVNHEPPDLPPILTTAGAERHPLPNGYCEPHLPVGLLPLEPLASSPVSQAFPPLTAPSRHPVRPPLIPSANYGNPRHKTLSVPAKMNESTATGNATFRSPAEYPMPVGKKLFEPSPPVLPVRANSVEHCDSNHFNPAEPQHFMEDKPSPMTKQQPPRRLASQRSAPTASDFLRLGPENSGPHSSSLIPSNAHPVVEQLNAPDSLVQPRRSPSNAGDSVGPSPRENVLPEPWQMPPHALHQPVVRAVNNATGITGTFPRAYVMTVPNGPRFGTPGGPFVAPLPVMQNFALAPPVSHKPVSCFNCGHTGHYGDSCPKKKPMDPDQAASIPYQFHSMREVAEALKQRCHYGKGGFQSNSSGKKKYCSLQRDARLYPEKARLSARQPGPNS